MAKPPSGADPPSPKPRRAKGEGSIRKRADGRWEGSIEVPTGTGKRERKYVYAATKPAVRALLAAEREAIRAGLPPTDARRTVNQFLDEWLPLHSRQIRPATARRYESVARLYIRPRLGKHVLATLTAADLARWLDGLADAGVSSRVCLDCYQQIRTALTQAWRWRYVRENVAALIDPPRHTKAPGTALTPAQARGLLDRAAGTRWHPILATALYTAMRQGEILALRWADVQFGRGRIVVRATLDPRTQQRAPTKTEGSERNLPLVGALTRVLQAQRDSERFVGRGTPDDYCFPLPDGRPRRAIDVYRAFKRLLARPPALPAIRFHDLRATAITFLLHEGVPPSVVMALAGHTLLSTTQRYLHVTADGEGAALERLAGVLDRGEFGAIVGQIVGQGEDATHAAAVNDAPYPAGSEPAILPLDDPRMVDDPPQSPHQPAPRGPEESPES